MRFLFLLLLVLTPKLSAAEFDGKKMSSDYLRLEKSQALDWIGPKPSTAGKFTMLDISYIHCPPCEFVRTFLGSIQERFKDNLSVISIKYYSWYADENSDREPALSFSYLLSLTHSTSYFRASDPDHKFLQMLRRDFKIESVPYIIILSPDGIVNFADHATEVLFKDVTGPEDSKIYQRIGHILGLNGY